jgi:hypothetical protein
VFNFAFFQFFRFKHLPRLTSLEKSNAKGLTNMVALRKTDYQHPDYRQQALDLIEYATQRTHIITFPTAFLGLLGYQHEAAILLNQILYWSSRTSDPEGWFYKTYDEWFNEIGLTRYQIERALNGDSRTRSKRLTLREIGVHTVVRKAPTGNPTVHYRIDMPLFIGYLEAFLFQYNTAAQSVAETQQSAISIVNNVAEQNVTESPNETQQSRVSSISKDSQSTEESKSLSDERFSLYKPFEKFFGKLEKLSNETLTQLLEHLIRLGSRTTLDVIERCTAYGKSWHYALTALKNECSANVTVNYDTSLDEFLDDGTDEAPADDMTETIETPRVDFRELLRRPPAPRRGDPIPTERIQLHTAKSSSTIAELWRMASQQLDLQTDNDFRLNCLRYLKLVDFEPETNCFVFAAENNTAADETLRRERTITRMLTDVSGVPATFRTVRKGEWATVE